MIDVHRVNVVVCEESCSVVPIDVHSSMCVCVCVRACVRACVRVSINRKTLQREPAQRSYKVDLLLKRFHCCILSGKQCDYSGKRCGGYSDGDIPRSYTGFSAS